MNDSHSGPLKLCPGGSVTCEPLPPCQLPPCLLDGGRGPDRPGQVTLWSTWAGHSLSTHRDKHWWPLVWLQLSRCPLIRDLRQLALMQALYT